MDQAVGDQFTNRPFRIDPHLRTECLPDGFVLRNCELMKATAGSNDTA